MMKKRILVLSIVGIVLVALIYLQFRTWRNFDWATFLGVTRNIDPYRVGLAILIIYVTYVLRAVRWKVFLRPVCGPRVARLIPPHFIGFTGLALLGRPGELIRPYLIARREKLPVPSQLAVWAVERIFDVGAFSVLMAIDVFVFVGQFDLEKHMRLRLQLGGGLLVCLVIALGFVMWTIRRNSQGVADWLEPRISSFSDNIARGVCHKIRSFGEGLNTIHDGISFLQLVGVSLTIWLFIALAYREILHAYPAVPFVAGPGRHVPLHAMDVPHVLLLIGASMLGSLLQLPAVGGGSQLATITVMSSPAIFNLPKEQALSAGMMLWLVTFVSCVPIGLFFARREHLSLRKVTEESQREEENAPAIQS